MGPGCSVGSATDEGHLVHCRGTHAAIRARSPSHCRIQPWRPLRWEFGGWRLPGGGPAAHMTIGTWTTAFCLLPATAQGRQKWPRIGTPQGRFWSGIDSQSGSQQVS
jgi:hypothetical protein